MIDPKFVQPLFIHREASLGIVPGAPFFRGPARAHNYVAVKQNLTFFTWANTPHNNRIVVTVVVTF
jgi:hypothetical protein